jgi:ADP-heptose:LPS heptosyltransferase
MPVKPKPKHIFIFRFSALGDVAMTVPVIEKLIEQNQELTVTVVGTPFVKPLFDHIKRCDFFAADIRGKHSGMAGLFRLFLDLKKTQQQFVVADLHQVLRTRVLSFFFRCGGHRVAVLNKGRKEKRHLTARYNKIKKPLISQFERYAQVFTQLGFRVDLNEKNTATHSIKNIPASFSLSTESMNVGIAPFAKHKGKCYPPEKMKMVVEKLAKEEKSIFLFGGGAHEIDILKSWENEIGLQVKVVAGALNFEQELSLISRLDVMCSMDSANMHLASLYNIPVVSVWGATHPYAGFLGFNQDPQNVVSENLECSPCSVFGNKPCWRGDYACMQQLSPEKIILAINRCDWKIKNA